MPIELLAATNADYEQLVLLDQHVTPHVIAQKIKVGEILVARDRETVSVSKDDLWNCCNAGLGSCLGCGASRQNSSRQ